MINGTSSYPSLVPGANGNNTTPLTFALSSSAVCGVPVHLSLKASYTGPVVPIPDNSAAGVNIPFVVTQATAISDVAFHIGGTTPCSAAAGATTVGIDHTSVGDLSMTLTSPAGTTVIEATACCDREQERDREAAQHEHDLKWNRTLRARVDQQPGEKSRRGIERRMRGDRGEHAVGGEVGRARQDHRLMADADLRTGVALNVIRP